MPPLLFHPPSAEARPRGLQVRQRPGGGGGAAKREVLHPPARGHRDLLVHVEVHPRPQVPPVGLGSGAGEELCVFRLIRLRRRSAGFAQQHQTSIFFPLMKKGAKALRSAAIFIDLG